MLKDTQLLNVGINIFLISLLVFALVDIKSDAGKHYGYYYYPHYSYHFCSTSLDECYGSNYGYQYDSSLGIKCRALNSGIVRPVYK